MNVAESINGYEEYFTHRIAKIEKVRLSLFPKILYFAAIESLARSAFPTEKPSDRFELFLKTYCDFKEMNRISMPVLEIFLRVEKLEATALGSEVTSRVQAWQFETLMSYTQDPEQPEMEVLANNPQERKLILRASYLSLLYELRNTVVHEFRLPGMSFPEPEQRDTPYYFSVMVMPWQLTFSGKFLERLCSAGLRNYMDFCRKNGQNPKAFVGGSFAW